MPECTEYSSDGDEYLGPCHCPVCKGFLKWVEKDGEEQPVCNKCHTPLIAIPDAESTEDCEWGKICALKPLSFQVKKKNNLPKTLGELAEFCKNPPKSKRKKMLRWKCPTNQSKNTKEA